MDSTSFAKQIVGLALEAKAQNLKVLDLTELTSFTDYFIIASGSSDRQVRSICDRIVDSLKKEFQISPYSTEGESEAKWIIIDFIDVVVHLFQEEARAEYDLEGFWEKARVVRFRFNSKSSLKSPTSPQKKPKKTDK